ETTRRHLATAERQAKFTTTEQQQFHGLIVEAGKQATAAGGWEAYWQWLMQYRHIGLELGEGGLEDLRGLGRGHPGEQIRRHIVGRPERGVERIGAIRCQGREFADLDAGMPDDDRMPDPVDAAATGASGQLSVFARGDRDMGFAVE